MGYRTVGRKSRGFREKVKLVFEKQAGDCLEAIQFMMKFLSTSWQVGRIRGVEIRFHISMVFSILLAYFIFHPANLRTAVLAISWWIGLTFSIFLHELGHAFAARLVDVEVKSIVLWLLGGLTNLAYKPEKPSYNLVIAAAGPLVNMALGFLFVAAYIILYLFVPRALGPSVFIWVQTALELCLSLAFLNVILIAFNLLPIYPLDGGNIMHALLDGIFGRSNADWITMLVSIPILLCLIAFGIVTHDYLLLASCILIGLAIGTLNRSTLRHINLGLNYLFKRSGYYFLLEDYERAAQLYTLEIEKEPGQPNHYLARAACLLNILQKERALADVERALKLAPNHPVALQLRGEMYFIEKDFEAALGYYSRVQEINPNWAVPYFDRASIHLERNELAPALEGLNKAITLTSQLPLFYVVRSLVNFKLGNLGAAHQDQDSALRLSEKDALTVSPINMTLYEGRLDWAEDFYGYILSKKPRSPYAYQGRADAYAANREYARAIADYTRAIEFNIHEAESHLGRGRCYHALDQITEAVDDFKHVAFSAGKLHLKRQAEESLKVIGKGE